MLKIKLVVGVLFFVSSFVFSQIENYNYKREIKGVKEQWHKVILPNDIFGKITNDYSDIRIFGITANHDTIEAPYLLHLTEEKEYKRDISFKLINSTRNANGYYFTFEIPSLELINNVKLLFTQQNFDWMIGLEGSQNQENWYTISDQYRILSINNEFTDYNYTDLTFTDSKFKYYRVKIESKELPQLEKATVSMCETVPGKFNSYSIEKLEQNEDKHLKKSEIYLTLKESVAVSQIEVEVKDAYDYYRPISIQYLSDSIQTEKGWKYQYTTLTSDILNSIEKNSFKFISRTTRKLKLIIENHDNRPLTISNIYVKGYVHEIVARFTDNATYYLTYGSSIVTHPKYDIEQFTENIPESPSLVQLGKEELIERDQPMKDEPLFKNKWWLWVVMSIIVLILGWFSLKMIKGV